ncbi:MAG: hypothetical protein QNK04_05125 [Myxococcota bacterium]|nr:hypothetical protein [Myxococcota bacterium]
MNRILSTFLVVSILVSLGCAKAPELAGTANSIASGRLLVAPLNLGVTPPQGFEADPAPVWDALLGYLRTLDRQVAVLDPIGAERAWLEVTRDLEEAGEPLELEAVSAAFARRVQEDTSYAALVLPSIVARRARLSGYSARWDGVRRGVPVPALLRAGAEVDLGPGFATRITGYSGSLVGASLYVALLTPDGGVASEGVGGLDLLQRVDGESTFGTSNWHLEPRSEPYANPRHLLEGIERAFQRPAERPERSWWPPLAQARQPR